MTTEQQKIDCGLRLIGILGLHTIRSGPDKGRVKTTWGTKSPLGVYNTVKRIVEEAGDFGEPAVEIVPIDPLTGRKLP